MKRQNRNKLNRTTVIILICTILTIMLQGCGGQGSASSGGNTADAGLTEQVSESGNDSMDAASAEDIKEYEVTDNGEKNEDPIENTAENPIEDTASDISGESADIEAAQSDETTTNVEDQEEENEWDVPPENKDPQNQGKTGTDEPEIIWIGDSLTQGSLGDDNFNKNNPQAPWRVLGEISGRNVAGVGFFGYKTSDIFWAYTEYNGIKDPNIIYIYWVGSNDFRASVDSVPNVIQETDKFTGSVGTTRYIFLGTTNRGDMDPTAYIGINQQLEKYYGAHYLDIMPYVEFGPDGVHLTESSYRRVAEAVYDKLKKMGYL